jgi:hypothetical protein
MEEERRELQQAKEEYRTPELVKHGTAEDVTQSGTNPLARDQFSDASGQVEPFEVNK